MTQQYQEESINGQPSAQSLTVTIPSAPLLAGTTDDAAIFFPTIAADVVLVGDAIQALGSAVLGTIFTFSQPGLYNVSFQSSDSAGIPAPVPVDILRGTTLLPVDAGNGYPAADFALAGAGVIGTRLTNLAAAPDSFVVEASFRISNSDLVDPAGGVNPNRQVRLACVGAIIPALLPPLTRLRIERTSM